MGFLNFPFFGLEVSTIFDFFIFRFGGSGSVNNLIEAPLGGVPPPKVFGVREGYDEEGSLNVLEPFDTPIAQP